MNLTKDEIDVIMCMLDDIDCMWGLKPEERELYERLTKIEETNDFIKNKIKRVKD